MNPFILSVGLAHPPYEVEQGSLASRLAQVLDLDAKHTRLLKDLFASMAIRKRYSVLKDYTNASFRGELFKGEFPYVIPCTKKRNEIYAQEAPRLALQAAENALLEWGEDKARITHVISVSCTGLIAPGIEYFLVDGLSLNRNCCRLGINFMGCFGAFRGISTAAAYAAQNPTARILVVCTELCSLHLQAHRNVEAYVSNGLFSDGAAAFLIGCVPQAAETPLWEIEKEASRALPASAKEMRWEVGNYGFEMHLSKRVPHLIQQHVRSFANELVGTEYAFSDCQWAIHPGGKAILVGAAESLGLDRDMDLACSWNVLENYGNMSSATFPFVLNKIRETSPAKSRTVGLGFGPGLSIEGVLLKNVF